MWFYCRGAGCGFSVKSGDSLRDHHGGCRAFSERKRDTAVLSRKRDRLRPPREAVYCENLVHYF
ncbi:MAG: hypothetical protein Harvfovirus45_6 [Harvfovirus sp.]|uniref:Uncharacterized protein n=1 Tax=Harvfovirus sp. TaxID=2487768 RepID=A0A3G5A8A7_9VIRU|nr:MAG: hypothetical protein Harvfovirus45_6 [Harvfovirus sp.]